MNSREEDHRGARLRVIALSCRRRDSAPVPDRLRLSTRLILRMGMDSDGGEPVRPTSSHDLDSGRAGQLPLTMARPCHQADSGHRFGITAANSSSVSWSGGPSSSRRRERHPTLGIRGGLAGRGHLRAAYRWFEGPDRSCQARSNSRVTSLREVAASVRRACAWCCRPPSLLPWPRPRLVQHGLWLPSHRQALHVDPLLWDCSTAFSARMSPLGPPMFACFLARHHRD